MGQSPDSSSYNDNGNGIPFYQGNADFGEIHPSATHWCTAPTKIAEKGDILISVRAPIGALNIANERCCIGRGLAAITVNSDIVSQDYIWYMLKSKITELQSMGTGSTFKAINKNVLNDVQFYLPSLSEQDKISVILKKTDTLIATCKKSLTKLDEIVKSRFVEMFGDPVTNPKKWRTMTFKQASVRLSDGPFGSNLKSEHYSDSGVRVIRLGNIGNGEFIDKDKSYIPYQHYEKIYMYVRRNNNWNIGRA